MYGLKKLDVEVTRILWVTEADKQPGIFRLWRQRHNEGKLSIEKKIEIIEQYSDNKVFLTLK
ncbi:MAG: hypothetical protein IT212_07760 [Bacteroidia bacterium]|nr:hypothetical protein [Bacteroidia bacterium]